MTLEVVQPPPIWRKGMARPPPQVFFFFSIFNIFIVFILYRFISIFFVFFIMGNTYHNIIGGFVAFDSFYKKFGQRLSAGPICFYCLI
jgi:hypothetical protein